MSLACFVPFFTLAMVWRLPGRVAVAPSRVLEWIVTIAVCATTAMNVAVAETFIDSRAIADENQRDNWLSSGRTYAENQFTPLGAIHAGNVKDLGLAWYLDLPGQRTLQATPVARDGVLYFSGTNGWVFAVDGRTGKLLWKFDPDLDNHPLKTRVPLFGSNRGVALWGNNVYVGTVDGRLVALEAKTGRTVWSTETLDEVGMQKTISGAPRAFNGRIFIGHGGYDSSRAYVSAYDARTGRKVWRFYPVPGEPAKGFENAAMAMAAKTWTGDWWKGGGHGVVWDNIVCDPEFNRVYIGTASAMTAGIPGDKLFTASIVALEADTGKYVWHYQLNPGSSIDFETNYDATAPMILADLTVQRRPRKVLMQAPKNGFFYVIDRSNGRLVSAEKIGKVNWAERVDPNSGRPIKATLSRDKDGRVTVWPSALGMHDWQKMSFHPGTGLVYIPTARLGMRFRPGHWSPEFGSGDSDDGTGALLAWDPVSQTPRWEVRHDSFWNGGTLSTAGNLVFFGSARGHLQAYDAESGKSLWDFDAGLGINAAPMSYAVDGAQYVSVLVGYGGSANASRFADYGWRFNEQPRRLLTFALGKHVSLPPGKPPRFTVHAVDDPSIAIDPVQAEQGAVPYFVRCSGCHGQELQNFASIAPDLRESALAMNWAGFNAVVREGVLAKAGMPKFADLGEDEARAIYMFIRRKTRESVPVSH